MALQKQALDVSFARGLDLKSDPFRVSPGNFLSLENSVFDKAGQLTKRNGYKQLAVLPNLSTKLLTTFNGNLTAIGDAFQAYSAGSDMWVNRGTIQPVQLNTLPLVRTNTNQTQSDIAIADTGLACIVYTDNIPNGSQTSPSYKYAVLDSVTGQYIVSPIVIPNCAGSPRVFVLGRYFVITFTALISATFHLQYISIVISNPSIISSPIDLSTQVTPSSTVNFDAVVSNNSLFFAWNGSDVGGAIRMTYIDSTLTQHNTVAFATFSATIMSVTADITGNTPVIYATFYSSNSQNGYVLAVNPQLLTILAPTQIITGEVINNITSSAQNMLLTAFYEVFNTYGFSAVQTDFVRTRTVTQAGIVGTESVVARSIGLASKSFILNENIYFLTAYQSSLQPSYFLISAEGKVLSRFAYQNGGGYLTLGLPNVNLNGSMIQSPYLIKDLIQASSKSSPTTTVAGIYSQTGINLIKIELEPAQILTAEIGNNLNFTGGFLWMYDGFMPAEQNFFIYPEDFSASPIVGTDRTGDVSTGSPTILNVSSTVGITVGMTIINANVPVGTKVLSFTTNTITMNANATGTAIGTTLTFSGSMTAQQYFYEITYEWTDNQGNLQRSTPSIPTEVTVVGSETFVALEIPTLRLTYKLNNPVKIVIYRWSVSQQNFYQTTSITVPLLNDPTVDFVVYNDILSDAEILGNNLIYTTGGVLEDTVAPATDLVTLFNNRLWLVDSEDRNLLWFSKQVIEATPVEMSDLLTIFVAPTTGAQGSTGLITALSPMDDKLIIFKEDALGYISGIGPDNTGANSQYSDFILINSVVGCIDQRSIVFMSRGLMFQSNKGIWLLGRDLSTTYIGAPVESLTTGAIVQSAISIPFTNQIRFTLDTGITLMYDYYYDQWGTFTHVPAISSTLDNSLHTYVNSLGQVFQESPGQYLDNTSPVLMSFTTGWMNLAGLQGFERFYQMYLLGTYKTPFKLNVQLAYDYNPSFSQNTIVTPNAPSLAWGGEALWGSGDVWGGPSNVFESRVFPQIQKCEAFQIAINEIYDDSFGIAAGAGLTLSGLNLIVGMKKAYRNQAAVRSFG